jgi:hypothetical protein
MTQHLYCTLEAIQGACTEAVFALPRPEGTPFAGVCRYPDRQEVRACELIVIEAIKWLAAEQPPRTRKAWQRMHSEVSQRAQSAVCSVGLLVLIGQALFWWLVSKALDWLWNWFRDTEEAPALICGMVAGLD